MSKYFTADEIKEVGRMWRSGMECPQIGRALGRTADSIRAIARRHRDECPARKAPPDPKPHIGRKASGIGPATSGKASHWDALRLMEDIPEDRRSLTGRIFGDPLPERSALARRQSA